jgi:CBS domain-containing protein
MENRLNIIFFLTPKEEVAYIFEDNTIHELMDKMMTCRYSAIPILKRTGEYTGTLTEGDVLWAIKNQGRMDFKYALQLLVSDVPRRLSNRSVKITADIEELFAKSLDQNFVPVEDDRGVFIGIVTRRNIIRYYQDKFDRDKSTPLNRVKTELNLSAGAVNGARV